MAPEGPKGRKNIGLRREDAARDRMKEFGFKKPVINASIKQVLKVYGEDQWFLIEDANYEVSLIFPLKSKRNKPTDWRPRNTKKQLRKNQKKKSFSIRRSTTSRLCTPFCWRCAEFSLWMAKQ
ncbi:Nucleolar histone methyltransferase-related protein [Arabidopsis thaliana]|jgi:hypothetical protein|uniref:Nucleolar histone methyltransferase-related protein n=1 Tax=Arabidopsis thaliana TaxID=3702 RepID=Q6E2A0_ARATH|nr:Nucleolar histone methyltransferase-related protein [Arabidopsis thaliana]NP_849776.2 Nucleolar histone methyltransferase-related protein [Arabidopsis thaliana]NP_973980.4 Nucleolar histone methyltransferase-related protein [Arabidopsis thaliana]AAT68322.1 hypothetical protein At1g45248 [Arabidopsis thaliana]AAV63851.1 hypothetical protein [Arabidopsis thaliana]AEE32105.1 Nucleolar histone methyltransferase-related protein [Arabidopsis thaliana]AEE32106.1 Nucleolar histone methyltransferas|eukprot:NP_001154405.1 Nucleolar histone methyltransferase-related protein [Arabidopsis thaliana]